MRERGNISNEETRQDKIHMTIVGKEKEINENEYTCITHISSM